MSASPQALEWKFTLDGSQLQQAANASVTAINNVTSAMKKAEQANANLAAAAQAARQTMEQSKFDKAYAQGVAEGQKELERLQKTYDRIAESSKPTMFEGFMGAVVKVGAAVAAMKTGVEVGIGVFQMLRARAQEAAGDIEAAADSWIKAANSIGKVPIVGSIVVSLADAAWDYSGTIAEVGASRQRVEQMRAAKDAQDIARDEERKRNDSAARLSIARAGAEGLSPVEREIRLEQIKLEQLKEELNLKLDQGRISEDVAAKLLAAEEQASARRREKIRMDAAEAEAKKKAGEEEKAAAEAKAKAEKEAQRVKEENRQIEEQIKKEIEEEHDAQERIFAAESRVRQARYEAAGQKKSAALERIWSNAVEDLGSAKTAQEQALIRQRAQFEADAVMNEKPAEKVQRASFTDLMGAWRSLATATLTAKQGTQTVRDPESLTVLQRIRDLLSNQQQYAAVAPG